MKCFPLYCLFILLLCKYLSLSLCPYYYCLFMILCLFPRWVLDHLLGFVWEVPLGGRNLIPPRHVGFYFPCFIFISSILFSKQSPPLIIYVIPLILLHNPHSPLLYCTYVSLCVCVCVSRQLNIKEKIFYSLSLKWFLNLHQSTIWVCLIRMVDGLEFPFHGAWKRLKSI